MGHKCMASFLSEFISVKTNIGAFRAFTLAKAFQLRAKFVVDVPFFF